MEGADFLKLEELILLAIAGKSEIYGLEIATDIATASEDKVQLNYGSLYPYLNRLEKKGYITSRWEEENARKGARRKYYRITDKGTQSLDEATLIRQKLRQQSDVPTIEIDNRSQQESDIERARLLLQHPEEKERIRAIYRLEYEAKIDRSRYWEIMKVMAAFIRINSPIDKTDRISPESQAALDVIGNSKIARDDRYLPIDLSRTNLTGSHLTRANLTRANLSGANLSGANLLGANLLGANLLGVKNMTIEQLHSAHDWEEAIDIPDYLKSTVQ